MKHNGNFVEGPILSPLLRFTLPVLLALFLQAMYGAVDLAVVGQFGQPADVSAVSTGSQVMHTVTCLVTGLSVGATVLLGQKLGEGKAEEGGQVLGSAIALFGLVALALTAVMIWAASPMAQLMQAPEEAFAQTVSYVLVCSGGAVFIVAYNVLGAMFRGIGDSKTPLLTVLIACVVNIAGDLLLVGACGLGVTGAALAGLFARDAETINAAADYLRAYAIDTLLTSLLFCFIGYFNGRGNTTFVMAQGIVGAFLVRIPVSMAMSRLEPVSLFRVGLATPCSTAVQIVLFLGFYAFTATQDRKLAAELREPEHPVSCP